MFAHLADLRIKERRPDSAGWREFSAIERRFPHIAHELSRHWGHGDIDAYMNSLLIDDRGERLGFPDDVLEELVLLAGVRWYLSHQVAQPIEDNRLEPFQFGVTDFDASQARTIKGGWVL